MNWTSFLLGVIVGSAAYTAGLAYWINGVNGCLRDLMLDEERITRVAKAQIAEECASKESQDGR